MVAQGWPSARPGVCRVFWQYVSVKVCIAPFQVAMARPAESRRRVRTDAAQAGGPPVLERALCRLTTGHVVANG